MDATFYPMNSRLTDDVLDVCYLRNFSICHEFAVLKELSSDHLPVIISVSNIPLDIIVRAPITMDWEKYKNYLEEIYYPHMHIMTREVPIDQAIKPVTDNIQEALKNSQISTSEKLKFYMLPGYIRNIIRHRNKIRHRWKKYGITEDKINYMKSSRIVNQKIKEFRK